MTSPSTSNERRCIFDSAEWYDRTINWAARLGREIPVLTNVFGPPGEGGLLDAGCGTGHQASALANIGYRVVGADANESMLSVARQTVAKENANVSLVRASYAEFLEEVGGGFDGLYCLANSLAAAGSREEVKLAIGQFGRCLRPGGKLFFQVLNFARMRGEVPCVQGPRVTNVEGRDYVSVRQFHFVDDYVQVTNITTWNEDGWRQRSHAGRLYPVTLDELRDWCGHAGIQCESVWGGYDCAAFEVERSIDLLFKGTKS